MMSDELEEIINLYKQVKQKETRLGAKKSLSELDNETFPNKIYFTNCFEYKKKFTPTSRKKPSKAKAAIKK